MFPLQSHGYILLHLASDSMCSQPFCTEQKMKEPWDGSILCRMTYCEEHPTRKMLLVAVEPVEPMSAQRYFHLSDQSTMMP
jgi:hypothetical protein